MNEENFQNWKPRVGLSPSAAIPEAQAVETKFSPFMPSDRSKNRRRHFRAPAHVHRKMTCSPLSKELQQRQRVQSMLVQNEDDVQKFRSCEDITKGSKLATWPRFTGGNVPSALNECKGRKPMGQLSVWAPTPARQSPPGYSWTKAPKRSLSMKPHLARQERKMANARQKPSRRCKNKVILYATFIKN